jgi:SnoaL-like domain
MTQNKDSDLLFTRLPDSTAARAAQRQLQELADREEIRDLIATYAHRVAHGLANADLFTDDGAYIHRRSRDSEPEVVRGRKELDAHYVERPGAAGVATPMIHNSLLSINGDERRPASVRLSCASGATARASWPQAITRTVCDARTVAGSSSNGTRLSFTGGLHGKADAKLEV